MDSDLQTAVNPLTEEERPVRCIIEDLVDSTRYDILRSLRSTPMSPSRVAKEGIVSRQTASNCLHEFHSNGLVNKVEGPFYLTTGGIQTVRSIEECLEQIRREHLAVLSRSVLPFQILRMLNARPQSLRNLINSNSSTSGDSTIRGRISHLSDYGWLRGQCNKYVITSRGKTALGAYVLLSERIRQITEKAPFLQRLDPLHSEIPIRALADAEMILSSKLYQGVVHGHALKLCDPTVRTFRVLTSIYNPYLFLAYYELMKFGLKAEGIVDCSVYEQVCEDGKVKKVLDNDAYENYRYARLDEPLTLGIAIYDERKVAIGAYNEAGKGQHIAMIVTTNDRLVKWAIEKYEHYREDSHPTSPISPSDPPVP